jgi:hypothetical protein
MVARREPSNGDTRAAQSLIAGITDALRTATIDRSKGFEVIALLSATTDTISGQAALKPS